MTSLSLMIKPASSSCNLRCRYCFYEDISDNREQKNMGIMTFETLEEVVRQALAFADETCTFAFQGGEPTIAGLVFFQELIRLQQQHNQHKTRILNAIQTNGILLDEDWVKFLHEHKFLVGLSLDGPAEIHDLNRIDAKSQGSFSAVMRASRLLTRYQVDFNILCVVTGRVAKHARKIYNFYQSQGFNYLQFIPCLEPIGDRNQQKFHLSPEEYGVFLCVLFDLWYADFEQGKYISVRLFDNLVHMLMGHDPEACNMRGICSINLVVEGNGNCYPCDFYAYDHWQLGNINTSSIQDLIKSETARHFIAESLPVPALCQSCRYYSLCRNGCKRDREKINDQDGLLYYCSSYMQFFDHALPILQVIAKKQRGLVL